MPRHKHGHHEIVKPDPLLLSILEKSNAARLEMAVTKAESACSAQIVMRLAASTPIGEIRKIAVAEFQKLGLEALPHKNGVLFYISLNRRLVEIVVGEHAVRDLPDDLWSNLAESIAAGFKSGNPTDALVLAIEDVGVHLALKFPPDSANHFDLPNVTED